MKKIDKNNFLDILSVLVPVLMIASMVIPGTYVYTKHDGSVHYGSYIYGQTIMIQVGVYILIAAVFVLLLSILGTATKKNMTGGILFITFVMLAFRFLWMWDPSIENRGWLIYVPPILCAAVPVVHFLAWVNRDGRTDEERKHWRNGLIVTLGMACFGELHIVIVDVTGHNFDGAAVRHFCLVVTMLAALILIAAIKPKNKTDSSGIL